MSRATPPSFIYGPIHSRRLGRSLGISPIPRLTCNMSCIYCQLGRITHMQKETEDFYPVSAIIDEFKATLNQGVAFDAVSIVGDGEPTLYQSLGILIDQLKSLTDKPVVLITNGALLSRKAVRDMVRRADIIMPSLDATDEAQFKAINRPHPSLHFKSMLEGLKALSETFTGEIHMEIMLIKGFNDDEKSLKRFKALLETIRHEKLYLNVPIRPPAETYVEPPDESTLKKAEALLGGIALNTLYKGGYASGKKDAYEALISIIARHPLNQFEVSSFLESRDEAEKPILERLEADRSIETVVYKGITTYRLRD
ncbi:MAG: radical SAM protein [Bacillota bacterium]